MPLNENSFERISDPIVGVAEGLTLGLLEHIRDIARKLVDDPQTNINLGEEGQRARQRHEQYLDRVEKWIQAAISSAYLRGIQSTNGQLDRLNINNDENRINFTPSAARFASGGGGGTTPPNVAEKFGQYSNHLTMYDVYSAAARNDFQQTQLPVVRDVRDKIRELVIQSSEAQYVDADTFTRRQFSQDLMNRFADDNITGIQYRDGRTVMLDSYSEMVARTQTGNAARQAQLNRLRELGHDLVRVSVHYPCSDLCIDWQGGVYSQSGTSTQYPPLDEAIGGGLFHANCLHTLGGYFPGVSEANDELGRLTKRQNAQQYAAKQRQRQIERNIRKYKRRKAAALTDDAEKRAQSFISKWQGEQRKLLEENDFLRRKYFRESIQS